MACIKSTSRSALAAFAPGAPYLAAGTMSGAVDLSFSSTAAIEIFELDFVSDSHDLPVVASCPSAERFNRLSWGKPLPAAGDNFTLGLLAGGLDDGSIGVWNPKKMIKGSDDAFVAKLEKHVGPVHGLEFNSGAPNMLASGADEGELCIWDLAKPSEPTLFPSLKGSGAAAQTEISFVSWNPKFQNIVASTSYNGITVAWDLRTQRPVTSFSNSNRRRCSVLQWNPDISTQLILASDDDNSPSLTVWDVRKTISPLREYEGHTKGVIAMSWCPYDSSFLLTCAKDNRTICWDTVSGEIACELPASTNWNFDVHWYPKVPGIISASSFDVKIGVYNMEACDRYVAEGEFVTSARLRAPMWLKRPTGVSFGFGGKLVSYQPVQTTGGAPPSASEVYVHQLITEHSLVSRTTEFEDAIQLGEKSSLRALCEKKSHDAENEDDKETWGFLKVMFDEDGTARTKLLSHLGFTLPDEGGENKTDGLGENLRSLSLNKSTLAEGVKFNAFHVDSGDDFFNNYQPSEDSLGNDGNEATNVNQTETEPEEPIKSSDSSVDDSIQRALVVGDYKGAVSQCIAANRIADALVIAHVGSPSLWESTRDHYLKSSLSPYLKVVSAMVNNDLLDLVTSRPLNKWKETLALLCTFAQKEEWSILCDTLASRLLTVGNRLAATLCYICSGNIDKTVEIWSLGLKSERDGKSYVERLQDLMEKTIVFALATGHKQFSASLTKLVENYAELLASQGLLTAAVNYLKLLSSQDTSHELAILRDRITYSIEETSAPKSISFEGSMPQVDHAYGGGQPNYGGGQPNYGGGQTNYSGIDSAHSYYQPASQPAVPSTPYLEGHQQYPYGGYQQPQQLHEMSNPASFQPTHSNPAQFQSTQPAQMFVPTPSSQVPQQNFAPPPATPQPAITSFIPATSPALTNAYRQPTLGMQLYSGVSGPAHQPGPPASQVGAIPAQSFAQTVADSTAPRGFMPVTTTNISQRPAMVPSQPSSPIKQPQVQSVVAPAAPPPTVQTVDTSHVSTKLKAVIVTLTRLYNETSAALGGAHAHPTRKREIEDNSRKIGSLFAKLNSGDISPNAADKLVQLCQALDAGDFASALQIQINLTTTDWDECNFWLAALKRMIKTRQNVRL